MWLMWVVAESYTQFVRQSKEMNFSLMDQEVIGRFKIKRYFCGCVENG